MNHHGRVRMFTVDKAELLAKVRANRETHVKDFKEAHNAWRKACVDKLSTMLANAKAGVDFKQSVNLREPKIHTKEYDRIIGILELTKEDQVEITIGEYANYVADDWDWSEDFKHTNSSYTGKRY